MTCLTPDWPAPKTVNAFTTTRHDWGNNDPKRPEERQQLQTLFNLPKQPIWLTQTHSTIVLEATPAHLDQIGDASFTHQTNQACVILTADCMPILICNKAGTQVAAIHAGWRGLAGGIIEKTIDALAQPASDLLVWMGPSIGPNRFEVGVDVFTAFTANQPEAASAFTPHQADKWLANLYELARLRLQLKGVSAIYGGNFCTYTQAELFFSYRRDKGHTGRMASLIWLS